jgi:membrane protein
VLVRVGTLSHDFIEVARRDPRVTGVERMDTDDGVGGLVLGLGGEDAARNLRGSSTMFPPAVECERPGFCLPRLGKPILDVKGAAEEKDDSGPRAGPQPQPEHDEPRLAEPKPRDLSKRDWVAILIRAGRESVNDHVTNLAAALAYYAFLAIPSLLLVAVGVFGLVAGDDAVSTIVDKLEGIAPQEALTLVRDSLRRVTETTASSGIALTVVGSVLALWTLTGAMQTLMWALNTAYDREETRGVVKRRLTALAMVVLMLLAFGLAFGLLVLGPALSGWVGSAVDLETFVDWLWWTAQWPVLILGLLFVFATILYLGPNVDHPRWRFLTVGTVVSVVVWVLASGAFAVFVSRFGSYNKAWGSLAAVIIMLTWLWISGLALLFGAEINAEAERSRELRRGEPAEETIQAPTKG